jgi:hypothetical protein
MALPVTIPNEFANATTSIPLSQLDTNFTTLANAVNGISDGSETLANVTATVVNATTVDTTNIEVTNIKAKDGSAAVVITDSTGAVAVSTALTANGGVVFNDAGADVDFRVEGDTDANLLFVDASADRVFVGAASSIATMGGKVQVSGTSTITSSRTTANAFGSDVNFAKSRGGTDIVSSGDNLGNLVWWGANGTGYSPAASIRVEVDGTPGASNDMPGRIVFMTTPDGSGTYTARMTINSSGNVGIGTSSPFTKLSVNGSIGTGSAITSAGLFYQSSTNLYVENTDNTGTSGNSQIRFRVRTYGAPITAATIDASGNLLVGKTVTTFSTAGISLLSTGEVNLTVNSGDVLNINRLGNDGALVNIWQDTSLEGDHICIRLNSLIQRWSLISLGADAY